MKNIKLGVMELEKYLSTINPLYDVGTDCIKHDLIFDISRGLFLKEKIWEQILSF